MWRRCLVSRTQCGRDACRPSAQALNSTTCGSEHGSFGSSMSLLCAGFGCAGEVHRDLLGSNDSGKQGGGGVVAFPSHPPRDSNERVPMPTWSLFLMAFVDWLVVPAVGWCRRHLQRDRVSTSPSTATSPPRVEAAETAEMPACEDSHLEPPQVERCEAADAVALQEDDQGFRDILEEADRLLGQSWVGANDVDFAIFEDTEAEVVYHRRRSRALGVFVKSYVKVKEAGISMMEEYERMEAALEEAAGEAAYWRALAEEGGFAGTTARQPGLLQHLEGRCGGRGGDCSRLGGGEPDDEPPPDAPAAGIAGGVNCECSEDFSLSH